MGGAQLCRAGWAAHVEVEWEDEGKVSTVYRELYVGSKQGNTQLAAHYNRQQAVETDTSVHSWRILAHPYTNFLCLLTSLFTPPSHFTNHPPHHLPSPPSVLHPVCLLIPPLPHCRLCHWLCPGSEPPHRTPLQGGQRAHLPRWVSAWDVC